MNDCFSSKHISWLVETDETLETVDGENVKVLKLAHAPDEEVLSSWAKHVRNHYCSDDKIDEFRSGTPYNRTQYLQNLIFPDQSIAPGPSIRSGDFAEILILDFLEYVLGYSVIRIRYSGKAVRNESTKGVDVIGFKMFAEQHTIKDALITFEAKANLASATEKNRLQDAIDDSHKNYVDEIRKAETLNALKRRLIEQGDKQRSNLVERFQNKSDRPFQEEYGAAAVLSNNVYDVEILKSADASNHGEKKSLMMVVVKGEGLMDLAHELYRRAASEA